MAQLQASFNEQQKLVAQSLQQMEALTIKQIAKEPVVITKLITTKKLFYEK